MNKVIVFIIIFLFLNSSAPSDMRYSTELCKEENDFLDKRKQVVFQAMQKLLGNEGPKTLDEVRNENKSRTSTVYQEMHSILQTISNASQPLNLFSYQHLRENTLSLHQ